MVHTHGSATQMDIGFAYSNMNHQTQHLLPVTGPLGKKKDYEPTNMDLLENAYKQNAAINSVTTNMQELKTTVSNHSTVIAELVSIRKTIVSAGNKLLWLLSFLGVSGVAYVGSVIISFFKH